MATVYRDPKGRFRIAVYPESKHIGDEYFKLYNSTSIESATTIARISFRAAKYIHHSYNDGKDDWILNSKKKKYLCEALAKQAKSPYQRYLNWQKAILFYNDEKGLDQEETLQNISNSLAYPKFLPFDLIMPDYTKLK